MASSYQTWTEWKISSRGFDINLLRAFWKRLFWKRSASKFYQLLKRICKMFIQTSPVNNFPESFCFFSGHFSKFSRKKYMEKFFFSWTACSFTTERLPHRRFVLEHFVIFSNNFSKSTPTLLYWNVLQSFSYFDNFSRWIVLEAANQRCFLKLAVPGPRKITYNFSKIRDQ